MVSPKSALAVFNATSRGASHIREGKPCQDYSASRSLGKAAIAAVADGHGGAPHFRSDRGARFAVEEAVRCIQGFICSNEAGLSDSNGDLQTLCMHILKAWRDRVAEDLRSGSGKNNDAGCDASPYGTTLLAAAITKQYWFALHVGDGKCVVLDNDASPFQPVPWDDRCFLNRTTSMCDTETGGLFRHFYSEELPAAVFLGSDGIDDSFPVYENDQHISLFYKAIYTNFINEGITEGKKQLCEMLPLLTRKGSGDDVSIAGFLRVQQ